MEHYIVKNRKGDFIAYTLSEVFEALLFQVDVRYSPMRIAKHNIRSACDLVSEICAECHKESKGGEKAKYTRTAKKATMINSIMSKAKTRKELGRRYFDALLSLEGMPTLPGFGMAKVAGKSVSKLKINPEKQFLDTLT